VIGQAEVRGANDVMRTPGTEERATFLESIAHNLEGAAGAIVERCIAETGPRGRLEGEVCSTAGQVRLFAAVARRGLWRAATIDSADPS
jgi:2,5-dioxopentanoate dehydrogenase